MSLGGKDPSTTLYNAVRYAYLNDILLVVASGNNGTYTLLYPAAYSDYVISVGAVDNNNVRASYSNYGSTLELVAPGGSNNYGLLSTYTKPILDPESSLRQVLPRWLSSRCCEGHLEGILPFAKMDKNSDFEIVLVYYSTSTSNHTYAYMYGTSMAAPHVSGLIALLMSKGITGNTTIRTILHNTAMDLGASGKDSYYGYGLIDAYAALTYTSSWEPLIVWAVDASTGNVATETYVEENGNYFIKCPPGNFKFYAWQDFDHTNSISAGDFYGYYGYPYYTSPTVVTVSADGNYTKDIYLSSYVDTMYKPTITEEIINFKRGLIEEHYK